MPKRSKKRSSKSRQNQSMAGGINPVSYVQPVSRIEKFRLSSIDAISTDGGGNILAGIPIDPTASLEWLSLLGLYEEFRIMGGCMHLSSVPTVNTTNPLGGMLYIAYDNGQFTTPVTVSFVVTYATRREYNILNTTPNPLKYEFKVPSVGGNTTIPWQSTAAYTPITSLQIGAIGLSASIIYFEYLLDLYVEFRTRS